MNQSAIRNSKHKPHKSKHIKRKNNGIKKTAVDEIKAAAVTMFYSTPVIQKTLPIDPKQIYSLIDHIRKKTGASGVFIRKLLRKHRRKEAYHKAVLSTRKRYNLLADETVSVSDEDISYHQSQINMIAKNKAAAEQRKNRRQHK